MTVTQTESLVDGGAEVSKGAFHISSPWVWSVLQDRAVGELLRRWKQQENMESRLPIREKVDTATILSRLIVKTQ